MSEIQELNEAQQPEIKEFNEAQKAVLKNYGGGDYSYFLSEPVTVAEWPATLNNIGDGLFKFLLVELDDKEDCDTPEEAMQRVDSAIRQLQEVRSDLDDIDEPARPALG